jgi:hypothetical protein
MKGFTAKKVREGLALLFSMVIWGHYGALGLSLSAVTGIPSCSANGSIIIAKWEIFGHAQALQ